MTTELDQLENLLELYDPDVIDAWVAGRVNGNGHHENGNGIAEQADLPQSVMSYANEVAIANTAAIHSESGAWVQKQLDEVADPGVPLMEGEDGRVCMAEMVAIERIVQEENFLPAHFLVEGAVVQKAVGRVTLKEPHAGLPKGNGWGTGFMVAPSILMTNNHVIPSKAFAKKVEVQFNYQLDQNGMPQSVDTYQLDPEDLFYTSASLDFTLIRVRRLCRLIHFGSIGSIERPDISLNTPTPASPFQPPFQFRCYEAGDTWGFIPLPSSTATYAVDQRINIVQHPRGRRKEIALHDNTVTNVYTNHVRYTTDTEPGSSGSPVFNNSWDVVAIHHAGGQQVGGQWINNQGVRLDKIVANIRAGVSPDVLNELNLQM